MKSDDILPYLDDLRLRKRSNVEVAEIIGCSPRHISWVLRKLNVTKIPGVTKTHKANVKKLTQARYEFRENAAKTMTIKQAMRVTGLSERSIWRWRAK